MSFLSDSLFQLGFLLATSATRFDLFEEIVTLVVNEDECREVLNADFPDGLHAQFRIFNAFDALDVVLSKNSCRTTNATQVETAMFLASVGNLL